MTGDADDTGAIARLLGIVAALRTPGTGCPWDLQQTYATIAPYTIEEAHEVADAIIRDDRGSLRDELGDLLFQVVFHARIAEEEGAFGFDDVVRSVCEKMLRRHPHVFSPSPRQLDVPGVNAIWREAKAAERAAEGDARLADSGVLDGVATSLPAFAVATKLQDCAAEVGFDWPDPTSVLDKIAEETAEVRSALASLSEEDIEEEIGDLLFAVVNLARHAKVDPDMALRRTNRKFIERFRAVEAALRRQGKSPATSTLAEMERLWVEAKARNKQTEPR